MKKTICLIRHGQTDQNKLKKIQGRKDFPLNDFGRFQAEQAALYLKKSKAHFDIIYSSPLSRAVDTANIIKNGLELDIEIIKDAAFIERDFGESEGLDVNKENFVRVLDDSYEGLEKSYEIQNRVYNGLLKVLRENEDKESFLIVCHSHTIKALLTKLDKNRTFMDPLCNCAINYFIYENNEVKIDKINIDPLENANL